MEKPSHYSLWNLCRLFGGCNEKIFGTVCIWGMLQRCHKKTFISDHWKNSTLYNSQHVCQILKNDMYLFFNLINIWIIPILILYSISKKHSLPPIGASNHSSSFKIWPLLNIFQSRVQSAYNFVATSQSTLQFIIFSRSGNNPKNASKTNSFQASG